MNVFRFPELKTRVHSVILPQTGATLNVRSLSVAETSKIRGSSVTPSQVQKIINEICWECVTDKGFRDYSDFSSKITALDRQAILYGIHVASFGEMEEFKITCENPECETVNELKFDLNRMLTMNAYPYSSSILSEYKKSKTSKDAPVDREMEQAILRGEMSPQDAEEYKKKVKDYRDSQEELEVPFIEEEDEKEEKNSSKKTRRKTKKEESTEENENNELDILRKTVRFQLPVTGLFCTLKSPTMMDIDRAVSKASFTNNNKLETAIESLVVKTFEQENEKGEVVNAATMLDDIFIVYNQLPIADSDLITEQFEENFGKYKIEFKTDWGCKKCGHVNHVELDITTRFFLRAFNRSRKMR